MNKITSTLVGLAVAGAAGVVPAFAQGVLFNPPGSFTFAEGAGTFTASSGSVGYNPAGGAVTMASFSLMGTEVGATPFYTVDTNGLSINGVVDTAANGLGFSVLNLPSGGVVVNSSGVASDKTGFNLINPVPEASTVVSFGALLALGGLAVLRRKSVKA